MSMQEFSYCVRYCGNGSSSKPCKGHRQMCGPEYVHVIAVANFKIMFINTYEGLPLKLLDV